MTPGNADGVIRAGSRPPEFLFDASQYGAELAHAEADRSWKPRPQADATPDALDTPWRVFDRRRHHGRRGQRGT
jgi:hypothetical protein